MPSIRSFIAIPLDQQMTQALSNMQRALRGYDHRDAARWPRPESIHLTLKFLGDIDSEQLPVIGQTLRKVCEHHFQFTIQAHGLGCFPNTRRSRVIWVGVKADDGTLDRLQKDLEQGLEGHGFPRERRPFSPHLTIARINKRATRQDAEALGRAVTQIECDEIAQMTVDHITLMRSDLRPQGPVYTELSRAQLASG